MQSVIRAGVGWKNKTRILILGHGGEGIGGRNVGFDSLKSRFNRDFRWMWKDLRRWRTRHRRLFIISSGPEALTGFGRDIIHYVIDVYILNYII